MVVHINKNLVRAFCGNFSLKKDKLTSIIKGVPISLLVKEFGEFLKTSFVGAEIRTDFDAQLENYVKKYFYYIMYRFHEDEVYQKRRRTCDIVPKHPLLSASGRTLDNTMLLYFLCYMLVPRYSNHVFITYVEMKLMFVVKNGIPVNWSYVIMHHKASHTEKYGGLAYARLLTMIFKYYIVNLTNELHIKMNETDYLITTNIINIKIGVLYEKVTYTIKYLDEEMDNLLNVLLLNLKKMLEQPIKC